MLVYINDCSRIFLFFFQDHKVCDQTALTALLPPLQAGCHRICKNQRLAATQTADGMSKLQHINEEHTHTHTHTHTHIRTTFYASKALIMLKLQETDHTSK
jgi:hypothetical protein